MPFLAPGVAFAPLAEDPGTLPVVIVTDGEAWTGVSRGIADVVANTEGYGTALGVEAFDFRFLPDVPVGVLCPGKVVSGTSGAFIPSWTQCQYFVWPFFAGCDPGVCSVISCSASCVGVGCV